MTSRCKSWPAGSTQPPIRTGRSWTRSLRRECPGIKSARMSETPSWKSRNEQHNISSIQLRGQTPDHRCAGGSGGGQQESRHQDCFQDFRRAVPRQGCQDRLSCIPRRALMFCGVLFLFTKRPERILYFTGFSATIYCGSDEFREVTVP